MYHKKNVLYVEIFDKRQKLNIKKLITKSLYDGFYKSNYLQ